MKTITIGGEMFLVQIPDESVQKRLQKEHFPFFYKYIKYNTDGTDVTSVLSCNGYDSPCTMVTIKGTDFSSDPPRYVMPLKQVYVRLALIPLDKNGFLDTQRACKDNPNGTKVKGCCITLNGKPLPRGSSCVATKEDLISVEETCDENCKLNWLWHGGILYNLDLPLKANIKSIVHNELI